MPKSIVGRWAGRSAAAGVGLLALVIVAYNTDLLTWMGQGTAGGLAAWILTAIAALGSLVAGLAAWVREGDHAPAVVIATIFGFLASLLLAMGAIPEN